MKLFGINPHDYKNWRPVPYKLPTGRWALCKLIWAMTGVSEADQRARMKLRKPCRVRKLRKKGRRKEWTERAAQSKEEKTMKRIEMGHAGHFILGNFCQFRRATYVNGYIVSTVGELRSAPGTTKHGERGPFEPLGAGPHLYESMVFHAVKSKRECCPYTQESGKNLFERRWLTADEAQREHEKLVRVFSKRKSGLKKLRGSHD